MAHSVREAVNAFRRAPLLTGLSATMIALSLFLLGLFGVVAHNIRQALERVEARVEIIAYLRDDAAPELVAAARTDIAAYPEVRDVLYVTKEQALARARDELSEFRTIFGTIDENPLPASLDIALRPNQQGADAVRAVAQRISDLYPFVEDVRYGNEWLDRVYLLRRVAGAATFALGAVFAIVASLIIGAAVRISIFARRDEIEIMRLVGATEGFVRRPFILEGLATGIFGGMIALFATWGAYRAASSRLFDLEWMPPEWIIGGLVAGTVLGGLASAIAVRRHLREIG